MNRELKDRFVEGILTNKVVPETTIVHLMDLLEDYENMIGKSVSEFTNKDVLSFYNQMNISATSKIVYRAYLVQYCEFCGYTNTAFHKVSSVELKETTETTLSIYSREDITIFESLMNSPIDRFVFEALFEGITGVCNVDAFYITKDNIDIENKTVNVNGNTYWWTDRLQQLFDDAIDAYTINDIPMIDVDSPPTVYKASVYNGKFVESPSVSTRNKRLSRLLRGSVSNASFKVKEITTSGLIHHIKEEMKLTGLDLKEYAKTKDFTDLVKRYGYKTQETTLLKRNVLRYIGRYI